MRRKLLAVILVVAILAGTPQVAAASPKTFDLDFRDAPLSAVLQSLARAARVNLVVEGQVSGKVTVHLANLTFDQALKLLAAAYRLTYTFRDGAYVVRQLQVGGDGLILPDGVQPMPVEMRAYPIRHANAEEVAAVLDRVVLAFSGTGGQGSAASPSPPEGQQPPGQVQEGGSPPTPGATPPSGPSQEFQAVPPGAAPPAAPPQGPQGAPPAGTQQVSGQAQAAGIAVVADPSSNTLLVAAPTAIHLQIQAVLRVIDVPGRTATATTRSSPTTPSGGQVEQVSRDSVAVTVKYADLDTLAKLITSEVRGITVNADARTRKLIITGPARQRDQATRLIEMLDRPVPQVMMSTKVVELSENASRKLGIQWNWSPQVTMTQVEGGIQFGSNPPGLLDMVGKITAAVDEGQGRVLANPQVASQDGKKATINVGQTLYFPITQTVEGQTTTTLQTVNAGIKLEVTPRIVDPKRLVAELNIEVNSLAGWSPTDPPMPIINSRSVNTTLEVADGSPIIIGGLISDTTTELLKKLPLLGDIPLIGELFKYRESSRQYSNIVIIIVPTILMPEGGGK